MNYMQYTLSEEHVDYRKDPEKFYEICHSVLNNQAPRKKKYIPGNNKPFMTKTYSRAITQRARFRRKYLKKILLKKTNYFVINKETSMFLF